MSGHRFSKFPLLTYLTEYSSWNIENGKAKDEVDSSKNFRT